MSALDIADIARLRALPTSTLHEAAGKIGVMPPAIKPVHRGARLCGPAVTVKGPGGDNLWLHRALYAARPGDVLVAHVSSVHDHGYWGEIMSAAATARELGGLVIDGCVRDVQLLDPSTFPVFARGACMRGTDKDPDGRGSINTPLLFGDLLVRPGDVVVGDDDGVVVLPRDRVAEILAAALDREARETIILERLRRGERTLDIYQL